MTVLIVEDENLAAKRLTQMLQEVPYPVKVVGVTKAISDTVLWLQQHEHPDMMLMDIELADGHSFEIFNQVSVNSLVVFTTSYDEYALKAFKLNSIDYLLKPIDIDDLTRALDKFNKLQLPLQPPAETIGRKSIEQLLDEMQRQLNAKTYRKRFLVKSGTRLVSVDAADIAFFYVEGRVVFLKTDNQKKYIVDYSMEELEDMLDPSDFFRINRSCLVARKSIRQIEEYLGSRLSLQIIPEYEKQSVVSREKVSTFKQWMGS